MGHIYRNLKPIPVPNDCYVAPNKKRVHRYFYLNGKRKYHVVGYITDDGKMLPNDVYRTLYPKEWNEAYGESVPAAHKLKAGMYGLTLGIGLQTGLYPAVQEAFGPHNGNIIMDLAMYLIVNHSNAMKHFCETMEKNVLFSRNPWSPAFISKFLSTEMTDEHAYRFRDLWLKKCAQEGRRQVWLCIDGSNVDCQAQKSNLARFGHSKSHNSTPIISFIWAVDATDGRPITWFVNDGNTPDCKAFDGVLRYLAESELEVRGVIIDRGFATQNVLNLIAEKGLDYIVMLKKNTLGFMQMLEKYRDEIYMNIGHSLDVDDEVFGKVDRTRLFFDSQDDTHVALYFSPKEGIDRSLALLKKIKAAGKKIQKQIANGKKNIEVVEEMRNFISTVTNEDGEVKEISYNQNEFNAAIRGYGYFAIASSAARDVAEILATYQLRQTSEVQFSAMKTQLGFRTARVHSDESIRSCMALAFVSIVVRNEIKNACQEIGLDTNSAITGVNDVSLTRVAGGEYEPTYDYSDKIGLLLGSFGVRAEHFKVFAEELNNAAKGPDYTLIRRLPELEVPRGRGRRKGSKNKKTLEREAREAEMRARGELPPKRGPGRPKGSKNKKTLEREAREAEMKAKEQAVKRGPGRPKGSKNKKTLEREAREAEMRAKAGRGRPKGSKNKETLLREARMARAARKNEKKKAAEAAKLNNNNELQGTRSHGKEGKEPQSRHLDHALIGSGKGG